MARRSPDWAEMRHGFARNGVVKPDVTSQLGLWEAGCATDRSMPLLRALSNARALLVLMSASMLTGRAVAQPILAQAPVEVTTDTAAYCRYLADRLHDLVQAAPSPPSHEVADLSSEGQHMCTVGQTRPGIMRLRLALMLVTHKDALGR